MRQVIAHKVGVGEAIHVRDNDPVEAANVNRTVEDPGFAEALLFVGDVLDSVGEPRRPGVQKRGIVLSGTVVGEDDFEILSALDGEGGEGGLDDVRVVMGPDDDGSWVGGFHEVCRGVCGNILTVWLPTQRCPDLVFFTTFAEFSAFFAVKGF